MSFAAIPLGAMLDVKAGLLTIPRIIDDHLYSSSEASRTIWRITGWS